MQGEKSFAIATADAFDAVGGGGVCAPICLVNHGPQSPEILLHCVMISNLFWREIVPRNCSDKFYLDEIVPFVPTVWQ
jgi:hypothetical protein